MSFSQVPGSLDEHIASALSSMCSPLATALGGDQHRRPALVPELGDLDVALPGREVLVEHADPDLRAAAEAGPDQLQRLAAGTLTVDEMVDILFEFGDLF